MKRIVVICLALALLAGCAPAEEVSSSGVSSVAQTAQEPAASVFSVGALDNVRWSDYGAGSNGGDAYYELATLTENASGTGGATRRASLILRTDYEALTQTPLCSVPGCAHSDASCPAYVEGNNVAVAAIGDRVYLMHSVYSTSIVSGNLSETAFIDVVDSAGTQRRRLVTFPQGWEMYSSSFLYTDGAALYGQYYDYNGNLSGGVRVELATGEYAVFELGGDNTVGVTGSSFVMWHTEYALETDIWPGVAGDESWRVNAQQPEEWMLYYDLAAGTRTRISMPPLNFYRETEDGGENASLVQIRNGGMYQMITQTADGEIVRQTLRQTDLFTGEQRELAVFQASASVQWLDAGALDLLPACAGTPEPYLSACAVTPNGVGYELAYLVDIQSGALREALLKADNLYGDASLNVLPLAQTNSGLWLMPMAAANDAWGGVRYSYALAAPETVFAGNGELRYIQMGTPPGALG